MFKIGNYQKLKITEETPHGLYLSEARGRKKVLLPGKEISDDMHVGDEIKVFLYLDSSDRIIATTKKPNIIMGQVKPLVVKEINKIGAFLDWGLDKDIFLPYKEMTSKVKEGDEILVRIYLDKSKRLAASMKKLYDLLLSDAPYAIGDEVSGRIYEFGHDFGTFVAVDDIYSAMLPKHEDVKDYCIGDVIRVRVVGIKDDGKLDISMRKEKVAQMDDDGQRLLELLDEYAGVLPFTEKATPDVIFRETGLSKAAFKRAVGRLYKERKIIIDDGKIRLV